MKEEKEEERGERGEREEREGRGAWHDKVTVGYTQGWGEKKEEGRKGKEWRNRRNR